MANRCRTLLRQQSKTPKHVVRIYVTLDTWQIVVRRYLRKNWEMTLRQQSKTLRHVLRIYVSLANWEMMEKTIFRPHLRIHVHPHSSRIYVSWENWQFQLEPYSSNKNHVRHSCILESMYATIKNSQTCITASRQFGYRGNWCRTFLRQDWKTPKHVIQIYVSLDTWQIVVTRHSRKTWEVPLRQQSQTLRHVLRMYVSLANEDNIPLTSHNSCRSTFKQDFR